MGAHDNKHEVYVWLQTMRKLGDESYFTYKEIHEGVLTEDGPAFLSVWRNVNKLWTQEKLESMAEGPFKNWQRKFRIKKEYV